MKRKALIVGILVVALGLLGVTPARAQDENALEGWVELLYRTVNVNGSDQKYDEDFDGLGDGVRIRNMDLVWDSLAGKVADHARLNMRGLGGDPWESIDFTIGKKDSYDLSASWSKQRYLYNLFGAVPDLDASTWDTERQISNIQLKLYPSSKIEVRVAYRENQRTGNTLFQKNLGDDFALPTPMDVNYRWFTVGAKFEAGPVDIVFEQTRREHTIDFNNRAGVLGEGQLGLGGTPLPEYDWDQQQSGSEDLTTVVVSTDLGQRVDLTASVFGTLIGEQELTDTVLLNTDTVTDGNNLTELKTDWFVGDIELSVMMHRMASVHLKYRNYTYDVTGANVEDLGATGLPQTTNTIWDWKRQTLSALFEIRPLRTLTFRLGGNQTERTLTRDGYAPRDNRDTDFKSDPDQSLSFGLTWRATKWFNLNADYEDTEIDQPFTAVSPFDAQRTKVRAVFTPKQGSMRAVVGYTDFQNDNTAVNFRAGDNLGDASCDPTNPAQPAGTCRWNSTASSTAWNVSWFHKAADWIDYLLRYSQQNVDTNTDIIVAGGTPPVPGLSVYDVDTTHGLIQVNFRPAERWAAWVRSWLSDADGINPLIAQGFTDNETARILQDYRDAEVGLRYTFPSKIFVGGAFRVFDYDDRNDLLDYDGNIFTLSAGMAF